MVGQDETQRHGGRRRRSDAERNTRRIVEAAIDVLGRDPRASMQTIALESGLGRATVYRHFPTREQLSTAIYRQALDDAETAVRGAIARSTGVRQALDGMVLALVRNGTRYKMVLDPPVHDPEIRQREAEVGEPMVALVARAQAQGLVRRDLDAPWLVQALSGILLLALRVPPEDQDDATLVALIVRTWLDGAAPR